MKFFVTSVITIMALSMTVDAFRSKQLNESDLNNVFYDYVQKIRDLESIVNTLKDHLMEEIEKYDTSIRTQVLRPKFSKAIKELEKIVPRDADDDALHDLFQECHNLADMKLRTEFLKFKQIDDTLEKVKYIDQQLTYVIEIKDLAATILNKIRMLIKNCYSDPANVGNIRKHQDCLDALLPTILDERKGFLLGYDKTIDRARSDRLRVFEPPYILRRDGEFSSRIAVIKRQAQQCMTKHDLREIKDHY